MILKLLHTFYCWLWNIQTQPTGADASKFAGASAFLDIVVIVFVVGIVLVMKSLNGPKEVEK